jgi:LmbE family N-acetylglucosaminyl deacetylase
VGDRGRPVFALGAHSDDLAFSLGAAFMDGRLANCRPVTVFSRSTWLQGGTEGEVAAVSARRAQEDRRFFSRTTAGAPLWLDLPDAPLRDITAEAGVFDAPVRPDELRSVQRALAAVLEPGARLLVPLALGGHVDHRLVRDAACTLCVEAGHSLLLYEDLPYAAFLEPPAIERYVAALARRLGTTLVPLLWASPCLDEAKAWAVASYASQTDGASLGHLMYHAARLRPGEMAERVWRPAGGESAAPW